MGGGLEYTSGPGSDVMVEVVALGSDSVGLEVREIDYSNTTLWYCTANTQANM